MSASLFLTFTLINKKDGTATESNSRAPSARWQIDRKHGLIVVPHDGTAQGRKPLETQRSPDPNEVGD